MSWENQYMHLVTTKPGLIVSEQDRELTADSARVIEAKISLFPKCYVELGSGSGMHLLRLAELNRDTLCIGFEIRFKRAFRTGEKAERDGLNNLLVLRSDARAISSLFKPKQVDGYFINYPDPWEKRRWRKNRLINSALLDSMALTLKPGGLLRYKTDHHEYFGSTLPLFLPERWLITKTTKNLLESPYLAENIPTEFEGLFKSQGRPLCMMEATLR
jgi:tRNA (guanine-N7-)-methyltransferase